ncbi:MAG TPA: carboxymuconolactone decarboxylase family protein [Dehalococcoidia bacterium]|nr:carboxymuconolactone decarboxylase family protein [Dehalococcoidia bacterium]
MTNPQRNWREDFPKLNETTQQWLFGDIWERPGLSKRDRSLITIAVNTALYRTDQLRGHVARGLDNGLTKDEIVEAITHVMFYGGWPTGVNGAAVASEVFQDKGL